ncbi:hypothetical protein NCLIV_022750 [Neospora caninum Liverpool]|uniref:PH domain-containing protein n=1 Tax=Neospora caninum (strain Liverpool) TaxID=572307 RepID=F0VFJ2_NEOCL|nr:hypothetical protein NCLIV_022750 [Neospora caninum Liverpool]CBZ52486.1 hypothetical protein NCLIV_022750 [Neospora caninum Liverpool]|eukprot:XP_003882518.1 hypothetical protein NCLIV_022750 [Neospora caninum Liverpool]
MSPARLDEDDEEGVLRKAERVILQQRNRLEQLSSLLLRTENEKVAAYKANQQEVERYLEENRKLRLHLDAANGEVAAMSTVNLRQEKMLNQLTTTLAAAEKGIEERDHLLTLTQSQDKTAENERLKTELQQMKCRVEKLTQGAAVGSLADFDGDPRGAGDVAVQLAKVQRDIDQHRATGKQLGLASQELRVSRMSLMQSQSDLLAAQKMVEEQRIEIQRLYKVIEALNREKSLVPPVVLAPANALAAQGTQEQLVVLSAQVQALVDKIESGVATKSRGPVAVANGNMNIFEEQKNLLTKVLESLEQLATSRTVEEKPNRWDLDKDVFFAGILLHGQTDDRDEFPLCKEKLVAVRAAVLAIFEDPDDAEPTILLCSHKVRQVRQDHQDLVYEIEYEVRPGVIEYHYLRCQSDEEMEKWMFALMYGGFVSIPKETPPPPPPPEPKDTIAWIVPSGRGPDGQAVPMYQDDAAIYYNRQNNMIICEAKGNPQETYLLRATKDNFDFLSDVMNRGRYCAISPAAAPTPQSVTVAAKPSPVRQQSAREETRAPPPVPKDDKEDELFVVRDGYLMLMEHAGDPEPLLKLFHSDCITTPDDANKEFVIRHMPGTPDEESYVFGFMTNELYRGWYEKLKANGFLDRKDEGSVRTNQVCVVTQNMLALYRYYGSPGATPVMEMRAERCQATSSRERREIRIVHTTLAGKRERITLDCATLAEFDRWNVALEFGGFLKADGDGKNGRRKNYANLSKYVFPVNLFEEDSGDSLLALVVKDSTILLYPAPNVTEPILSIDAADAQVQYVVEHRKIRVYVNRNTEEEERIDFILPLAKDYDKYATEMQRQQFPLANDKNRGGSRKPFIICKKNLLAFYKSKYQKMPEFIIDKAWYEVDVSSSHIITFKPRRATTDKGEPLPLRCLTVTTDLQMKKWDFCLKLIGFRNFAESMPPRFLPQIIYGFVSAPAAELRNTGRKFVGVVEVDSHETGKPQEAEVGDKCVAGARKRRRDAARKTQIPFSTLRLTESARRHEEPKGEGRQGGREKHGEHAALPNRSQWR